MFYVYEIAGDTEEGARVRFQEIRGWVECKAGCCGVEPEVTVSQVRDGQHSGHYRLTATWVIPEVAVA